MLQKGRLARVDLEVRRTRLGRLRRGRLDPEHMRRSQPRSRRYRHHLIEWRSVPRQRLAEVQPVDGAKRVEPVDRWRRALVLDVRQTAQRNGEFGVAEVLRDLLAGFRNFAIRQLQALASPLQLQPRTVHGMILAVRSPASPAVENIGITGNRYCIPLRRYSLPFVPKL